MNNLRVGVIGVGQIRLQKQVRIVRKVRQGLLGGPAVLMIMRHEAGTPFGKLPGDFPADTARGPRYQNHFV